MNEPEFHASRVVAFVLGLVLSAFAMAVMQSCEAHASIRKDDRQPGYTENLHDRLQKQTRLQIYYRGVWWCLRNTGETPCRFQ